MLKDVPGVSCVVSPQSSHRSHNVLFHHKCQDLAPVMLFYLHTWDRDLIARIVVLDCGRYLFQGEPRGSPPVDPQSPEGSRPGVRPRRRVVLTVCVTPCGTFLTTYGFVLVRWVAEFGPIPDKVPSSHLLSAHTGRGVPRSRLRGHRAFAVNIRGVSVNWHGSMFLLLHP